MGNTSESLATGKQRSRWTTLATLGLVMIALAPALMLGAGLAWGLDVGEDLTFFGIIIAAALLAALLVWTFGWWAKVVGILVGLAGGGAMFWTAFGLRQPASFFDFIPGLLVIPGAIIAVVSCIAAIVAGRRGHTGPKATGGERILTRVIIGLLVLAMVASGLLTYSGRESVADVASADQTVLARDFEFDPVEFEVDGGDTILVQNNDPFFHTFTIDELDINVDLGPGSQALVDVPDRPGSYRFYCIPHTSPTPEEAEPEGNLDPEVVLEDEEGGEEFDMSGRMTIS